MHPDLEDARKDIWDRPDKDGRKGKRPTSLGQLSGKSNWEMPLANWIMATDVGLVGQEMRGCYVYCDYYLRSSALPRSLFLSLF
jgi:hypothetical protein